jgi:hypothetical protein
MVREKEKGMREKTHRNQCQVIFISVMVSLLIGVNGALGGDYTTYRLLSGSTFTPKNGSQITGPAENLTGSFVWHYERHELRDEVFKMTSLHFESASYTLNLSPNNNTGFTIWDSSNLATIYADVNTTGGSVPEGILAANGTYSGPSTSPTYLNYPNIDLYPIGGGYYYGCLTLYAEQVPEPATLLLLGLGAVILKKTKK